MRLYVHVTPGRDGSKESEQGLTADDGCGERRTCSRDLVMHGRRRLLDVSSRSSEVEMMVWYEGWCTARTASCCASSSRKFQKDGRRQSMDQAPERVVGWIKCRLQPAAAQRLGACLLRCLRYMARHACVFNQFHQHPTCRTHPFLVCIPAASAAA
ncbi:hypothetical protein K440DRAFT_51568 [Wilcoxina mikolae CBS 423.85]|nr:hypothetical protein K440DRAFT_51568 [Wilcoxina mikolae CBS 423.85]